MHGENNREKQEPKVIVERVPERHSTRYFVYSATVARPRSGLWLILWLVAGMAALCLVVTVGILVLLAAVGTGLLYAAWRWLAGRK
jgi:hypothetical protein